MRKSGSYLTLSVAIAIYLCFAEIVCASSWLFTKIPESNVDSGYVERSTQLVGSLYDKWQNGTFEPVGDEFTTEMQKGLSPELQKQSFEQIRAIFGDYQGMTFVEVLTARFLFPRGTVYRFKGSYSRASAQPEIRVVFDSAGKVSGLWIKHWKDEIQ